MGRQIDPQKKEFAYALYMSNELQKVICERVGIAAKTLQSWIQAEGWGERRAAKTVTKSELVNKTLSAMATILDRLNDPKEKVEDLQGLSDQLSKQMSTLQKLDKGSSVIDDMETFMQFNGWLQRRLTVDKELTIDIVKTVNKYQDLFINDRLAAK